MSERPPSADDERDERKKELESLFMMSMRKRASERASVLLFPHTSSVCSVVCCCSVSLASPVLLFVQLPVRSPVCHLPGLLLPVCCCLFACLLSGLLPVVSICLLGAVCLGWVPPPPVWAPFAVWAVCQLGCLGCPRLGSRSGLGSAWLTSWVQPGFTPFKVCCCCLLRCCLGSVYNWAVNVWAGSGLSAWVRLAWVRCLLAPLWVHLLSGLGWAGLGSTCLPGPGFVTCHCLGCLGSHQGCLAWVATVWAGPVCSRVHWLAVWRLSAGLPPFAGRCSARAVWVRPLTSRLPAGLFRCLSTAVPVRCSPPVWACFLFVCLSVHFVSSTLFVHCFLSVCLFVCCCFHLPLGYKVFAKVWANCLRPSVQLGSVCYTIAVCLGCSAGSGFVCLRQFLPARLGCLPVCLHCLGSPAGLPAGYLPAHTAFAGSVGFVCLLFNCLLLQGLLSVTCLPVCCLSVCWASVCSLFACCHSTVCCSAVVCSIQFHC